MFAPLFLLNQQEIEDVSTKGSVSTNNSPPMEVFFIGCELDRVSQNSFFDFVLLRFLFSQLAGLNSD